MANNSLIGAIRAEATLESGKFVDGAKKIRASAKQTQTAVQTSFGAMGKAVKGFGGALAAGVTIGLLGGLAAKALEYAGSLAEVAQQVGVTARDLQVFRFAGGQVGVSTEQMDKALQKFTKSLGDARNGSAEAIKTFKALGFTDQDIKRLDVHDALLKTADGLAKVGDRATRASPEVRLLGRAGQQLDTFLSQGSKGINELAASAEKLGIVLSDDQIKHADETADKLRAVKEVLEAQIASAVANNATSILSLASALGQLTTSIIRFLGSNPQAALGIIGALAGSRFGLAGAAVGGIGGLFAGSKVAAGARDANGDLSFRMAQVRKAQAEVKRQQSLYGGGPANKQGVNTARKELDRQTALLTLATGSASRGPVPIVPAGDLGKFLAADKSGSKKKTPHDRNDDTLFQFDQEQRQADMDVLRAKQDLAHGIDERADIDLALLKLEQEGQSAELDNRVSRAKRDFAEGKITKGTLDEVTAQAEVLKGRNDEAYRLKVQAANEQRAEDKRQEANAIAEHEVSIRQDILQKQSNLAETAEERRKLELELLQIAYDQKKKALDDIVAHSKDAVEIANARADLSNLNANHALDQAGVLQSTRGPMEDYLASLPTTAAKANEALQRLQVQGMEGFLDSVLALSDGLGSAKDALLNTLKQFLLGLARLELQKGLGSLFSSASGAGGILGSIFGGGGSTSVVSGGGSFFDTSLPALAGGGSFKIGGNMGLDRNILSLNRIPIARVNYGERINVGNDNSPTMRGRGGVVINQTFPNSDNDSFRRNASQTARVARRSLRV